MPSVVTTSNRATSSLPPPPAAPPPHAPNVGRVVQGLLSHLLAGWIALQLGIGYSSTSQGQAVGRRGCVGRDDYGSTELASILRSFLVRRPAASSPESTLSLSRRSGSNGPSIPARRAAAVVDTAGFVEDLASGFPWNAFENQPRKGASQVLIVAMSSNSNSNSNSKEIPSSFFSSSRDPAATATATATAGMVPLFNRTSDAAAWLSCREVRQVVVATVKSSGKPNNIARDAKNARSCLVVAARNRSDSYLIQKWIQHGGERGSDRGSDVDGDDDHGWQVAGRYRSLRQGTNTLEDLPLSKKRDLNQIARDELANYLTAVEAGRAMERLQPLADRVAMAGSLKVRGTILVLTVNRGHADLFVNYVCAARAAQIDLAKILLVATDLPTYELATELGVAAFFDPGVFASVPVDAAAAYGDGVYAKVMMSKAYCVHLLSMTGHNLLFQDVDIIPYQPNYLEWWIDLAKEGGSDSYDLVFQSDFSNRVDYAPWYVSQRKLGALLVLS
jgi:Nucleotide-diphospho-sugar transferase